MTSQPDDPSSTAGADGSADGVLVFLHQMQHQMREFNQSLRAAHGPAELMDTVATLDAGAGQCCFVGDLRGNPQG